MNENNLCPPKPEEPLDSECCGTGCSPCVFDIYKRQLTQWEQECQRVKSKQSSSIPVQLLNPNLHLNPESYLHFNIIKVIPDTQSSKIFRFSLISSQVQELVSAPFAFSAPFALGQHVVLRIDTIAKPYTILGYGEEESQQPYFDLLVKVYVKGQLTPRISNLSPGSLVEFRGPFGKPYQYRPNHHSTIYMLAAGTGIAPMSRIIESITANEDDETRIKLVFCNRNVANILIKPTLKRWAEFWNFQAVHYLSKSSPTAEAVPYGMNVKFKRFTKSDFLEECKLDSKVFYLVCGSKSFNKDMLNYLKNAGVSEDSFHVF